jgi:hypothetical protein
MEVSIGSVCSAFQLSLKAPVEISADHFKGYSEDMSRDIKETGV